MFSPTLKPFPFNSAKPPPTLSLQSSITTSLHNIISALTQIIQAMVSAMKTSYLLPAILLNPILFLHSINTLLAQLFPTPLSTSSQALPFSIDALSHWQEQKIDMHANDNLCWSYTAIIVCAQCWAFGTIQRARERKRLQRDSGKRMEKGPLERKGSGSNGHVVEANGDAKYW